MDLKCVKCSNIFESMPITLFPCGWVVCSHHLESTQTKCFVCPNQHDLIRSNCISTKTIEMKYIRYRLENSLNQIKQFATKLHSDTISTENVDEIVDQIQHQRFKAIELLDLHFYKLLAQVQEAKASNQIQIYQLTPLSSNIDFESQFGKVNVINLKPEPCDSIQTSFKLEPVEYPSNLDPEILEDLLSEEIGNFCNQIGKETKEKKSFVKKASKRHIPVYEEGSFVHSKKLKPNPICQLEKEFSKYYFFKLNLKRNLI